MDLRRKLAYLHTGFAAFAVVAASATIYGVRLHVRDAANQFERVIDQSSLIDQIRVASRDQLLTMQKIVDGRAEVNSFYLAQRDAFFTQLKEVSRFGEIESELPGHQSMNDLATALEKTFEEVFTSVSEGRYEEAKSQLIHQIESDLLVALDIRLQTLKNSLELARRASVDEVLTANTQLLGLAALVAFSCIGLVIVGVILVHRWLIVPITHLQTATNEFANGNLEHRVEVKSKDELGLLGSAMNSMASSIRESERKYRSLFENLRDAIIICDSSCKIVECHDDDTHILDCDTKKVNGQPLLEIWPGWKSAKWEWEQVVTSVTRTGQYLRAADMILGNGHSNEMIVDVVAYPVEYSGNRYAAIVLRNVTERNRLQKMERRAETVESAVTFARGIAHDFKNLLHSAVSTLSLIGTQSSFTDKDAGRIQTALNACEQAAGLSRRLLNFATSNEGNPELLDLNEIIHLILDSLDEPFLAAVQLKTECDEPVMVYMDRDQLTQIILNLVRNSCEAMPEGGELRIKTELMKAADPIGHREPALHALLTLADTGCGMTTEVKERIFEPLFSTKDRGTDGIRGLGLSVVYTAVRNADGFIQVDSEIGSGTTFYVYLPTVDV